jgi:hypothetical protein
MPGSVEHISKTGPLNCRSLDLARDDKGDGSGSIESSYRADAV